MFIQIIIICLSVKVKFHIVKLIDRFAHVKYNELIRKNAKTVHKEMEKMKLNQPYYIEPRSGENHIDLCGSWEFFGSDTVLENPDKSLFTYKTTLPKSLFHSLHECGVLPDPYVGTNSKLYSDVDEKIWYYRKTFTLNRPGFDGNAFLCFDGVAYYCRVWVNGNLIGDHEGMFGGPVCDVANFLDFNGENTLVVEVKACNYGVKDSFDPRNAKGENTQIVPWNLVRDAETSNGDFIVMGIWNKVRLELTEKLHISRPYMYTVKADEREAELFCEFEIADGTFDELRPFYGYNDHCYSYTRAYDNGLTGKTRKDVPDVEIEIIINEKDTGKQAYYSKQKVALTDFDKLGMDLNYRELQYFSKTIRISSPKLWYPVGLGEPYLYTAEIKMYSGEKLCDVQSFDIGIRTISARRTEGPKYRSRWEDFRFSVNGKDFFLMGINWMPIDYLYSVKPEEYEWCITLAKNAGIQMLRIWSGGGMPETDTFYSICDRLGIMVWQDHMIANMSDTHSYPQDILESQEAYNIYRTRNHPSLAIHCGGNEFNPYSTGNASSMFVLDRVIRTLDPSRIFHYTTADKGSAHIYRDMEPVWYRHIYKDLPFVGESGIHSFPSYRSLKKLVREEECTGTLPDLSSKEFGENFPELLNHFTEYHPSRVPRMMSRASQIDDVSKMSLEAMCEATQVQAYEFYTLMIQSMRENYPSCGGILPWVFKRHWTTVGIQVVDGMGQPGYPYYAVQNAYRSLGVCLCLDWSVIAPCEEIPLKVKLFNREEVNLDTASVVVTVFAPDMTVAAEFEHTVSGCESEFVFDSFKTPEAFTDKCFLISARVALGADIIARTVYFVKCTSALADGALYEKYRSAPAENLYFSNGPWLKPAICGAKHTGVDAVVIGEGKIGSYRYFDVRLHNTGDIAAYPVTLEPSDTACRFFTSDNFFMLYPDEVKNVRITCDGLENNSTDILVKGWNFDQSTAKC